MRRAPRGSIHHTILAPAAEVKIPEGDGEKVSEGPERAWGDRKGKAKDRVMIWESGGKEGREETNQNR